MERGKLRILTKPEETTIQVNWLVHFMYESEQYVLWSSSCKEAPCEYIIYHHDSQRREGLGEEVDSDDPKFEELYEYIHEYSREFKHYKLDPGQEFIIQ
jgi:hypothetical protein